MGNIGSHLDITSGRRGHQAKGGKGWRYPDQLGEKRISRQLSIF
jgi:hypothetical protein